MSVSPNSYRHASSAGQPSVPQGFMCFCREVHLRRTDEVGPLLDTVTATMVARGYPADACREMRLALEEGIVNGLRHGNGGDPAKRVRVRYHVGADAVVAEIEDEGPGFNPAAVPDPTAPENLDRPTGRGLLLMRHYTDWLCHHGCGNHVTLCKYRVPA
jgi:serine/threonine-protein kinase RsbW